MAGTPGVRLLGVLSLQFGACIGVSWINKIVVYHRPYHHHHNHNHHHHHNHHNKARVKTQVKGKANTWTLSKQNNLSLLKQPQPCRILRKIRVLLENAFQAWTRGSWV